MTFLLFLDTATRLALLCRSLKRAGAKRVFACASHGLFTKESLNLIELSPFEKVIVTDSVPLPKQSNDKIVQVSIVKSIAKLLRSEAKTKAAMCDSDLSHENNAFKYSPKFEEDDDDYQIIG